MPAESQPKIVIISSPYQFRDDEDRLSPKGKYTEMRETKHADGENKVFSMHDVHTVKILAYILCNVFILKRQGS